jgi:hypothetical protein
MRSNLIPLTTFSQVDFPIELVDMYDYQQDQTFTRVSSLPARGKVTYTGAAGVVATNIIYLTLNDNTGSTLQLIELGCTVTSVDASFIYFDVSSGYPLPTTAKCSYRKNGDITSYDVAFGLQPTGKPRDFFKIRANGQGKGKVFIGEILRQYLPEFIAPKDYGASEILANGKLIQILFNGQTNNNIQVYYGGKYLTDNPVDQTNNPLGQIPKLFQEQIMGYVTGGGERQFNREFTGGLSIGVNEVDYDGQIEYVNLYPSIPCKNKIVLSSNYGLLSDGELIDVSVPVLAFVNRAGQYEYIRFTGSNVNKYNVQEARLKQDYASTLTNADIGLIYEGIELTLADDNTNQGFAYRIDKLEYQRCLALLMESPKAWLLVNGDLQQALEVRVKRESVVFASSYDKSYGNYTAQCEVIITQTLGQPQY